MIQQAISPAKKLSTTQLKQALQKIKRTQLEVLKVLRSQNQTANFNETNLKTNQNIGADLPYLKSISHINLLKMSEISTLRKEFQSQKERYSEKIANLMEKIKLLEGELELKQKAEVGWENEKLFLTEKLRFYSESLQPSSKVSSEQIIKAQMNSYHQQLSEKIKLKIGMENEIATLHQQIKEISTQKESYRTQLQEFTRALAEKQKNRFQADIKLNQQSEKRRLPWDEIVMQVKKIATNHQKVYQNLKTRARITVSDLDLEEQMQQSFSKLLKNIQVGQRFTIEDKKIEDDDSMIQGVKIYDSESFRDDVKKLQKQLFDTETIKKQLLDLKTENLNLKEEKNNIELDLLKTRQSTADKDAKLKKYQQRIKEIQVDQYQNLITDLETEMRNIREEKNMLSNLVKKISENAVRPAESSQELKNLREQVAMIAEMNENIRIENENYKSIITNLNISIENLKAERSSFQLNLVQKQGMVEKQVKEKQYLIDELQKLQKTIREKDDLIKKQEQKIKDCSFTIQNNFARYEADCKSNQNEVSNQRLQIEKHLREIRDLREVAYKYQLLTAENEILKKRIIQVNSNVIHLWQIKETEYANVDKLLKQTKKI